MHFSRYPMKMNYFKDVYPLLALTVFVFYCIRKAGNENLPSSAIVLQKRKEKQKKKKKKKHKKTVNQHLTAK